MKKERFTFKTLLLAVIFLSGSTMTYAQWEGSGTEEEPFLIKTVDDLALLSANSKTERYAGQYFRLENDLDLNVAPWNTGEGWDPIGPNTTIYFGGFFDGNGHIIRNLYINFKKTDFYNQYFGGLFGAISDGSVKDLGIENMNITVDVTDYMYIHLGGLVGRIIGVVTVSGCYTTGKINVTGTGAYFSMIGGLAGFALGRGNDPIVFSKCYSTCDVSAIGKTTTPFSVGGLMGNLDAGTVEDCYAMGDVTGETVAGSMRDLKVGGLLGTQQFEGIIRRCYATGNISATGGGDMTGALINYAGGVIGYVGADLVRHCQLNNCVAANDSINGLSAGRIMGGSASIEYLQRDSNYAYDKLLVNEAIVEKETVKDSQEGGNATQEELHSVSFYTSRVSWDMESVWSIWDGKNLPYLSWQSAPLAVEIAATTELKGVFKNTPVKMEVYTENGEPVEGVMEVTETGWSFVPATPFAMNTRLTILNYEAEKSVSYPVKVVINIQGATPIDSINGDQIHVYPVPVKDLLHIETNDKLLKAVVLYDRSGNILFAHTEINQQTYIFSTDNLAEGVYLLKVNTESGNTTHKVFKKK